MDRLVWDPSSASFVSLPWGRYLDRSEHTQIVLPPKKPGLRTIAQPV